MATKKGSAKPERGYIGRRWNPSWGEQYYLGESGPEGRPWGPANEENFALAVRFASRAEARLHFEQHRIPGFVVFVDQRRLAAGSMGTERPPVPLGAAAP